MEYPFYSPLDHALFENRIIQVNGSINSEQAARAARVNKQLLALESARFCPAGDCIS